MPGTRAGTDVHGLALVCQPEAAKKPLMLILDQTVGMVCSPASIVVDLDDPLQQARLLLRKYRLRELPVMHANRVVGLLTDRDVWLLLGPEFDYPPERELTVEDAYLANPLIVDREESLESALYKMAERRIGCALVTDNGRLAGVFTDADACRCFGKYLHSAIS